jgi:hypothetical protein
MLHAFALRPVLPVASATAAAPAPAAAARAFAILTELLAALSVMLAALRLCRGVTFFRLTGLSDLGRFGAGADARIR